MGASPVSLGHLISAVPQAAGIILVGG
jgi:hypothetical protein